MEEEHRSVQAQQKTRPGSLDNGVDTVCEGSCMSRMVGREGGGGVLNSVTAGSPVDMTPIKGLIRLGVIKGPV